MRRFSLKSARASTGMSQQKIADKMGVSRQSVYLWENGLAEMKEAYILAFCSITGFKREEIILPKNNA